MVGSSSTTHIWWRTPSSAVTSTSASLSGGVRPAWRRSPARPDRPIITGPVWALTRLDLADAVVLFDRRGQLVLADAVGRVVGDRGDRGEAGLHPVAPGQPIDVIEWRGVAHQHAGLDHALQVLGGLGVDRAVVGVGLGIEVDLGLGDMQEAPRLARGALARLRARKHVIGRRQDVGGRVRARDARSGTA